MANGSSRLAEVGQLSPKTPVRLDLKTTLVALGILVGGVAMAVTQYNAIVYRTDRLEERLGQVGEQVRASASKDDLTRMGGEMKQSMTNALARAEWRCTGRPGGMIRCRLVADE